MSLNRAQKRALALLLVARAKSVIADWDQVSTKRYNEIDEGVLRGIPQEDVRDVYAQWLGYLPNHAWDKVDEPSPSPAQEDGPQESSGYVMDSGEHSGQNADSTTRGGLDIPGEEHENLAVSEETPVMGSNEIVHEDDVQVYDVDADPTGDEQVVQQASAGGPQSFQYR